MREECGDQRRLDDLDLPAKAKPQLTDALARWFIYGSVERVGQGWVGVWGELQINEKTLS